MLQQGRRVYISAVGKAFRALDPETARHHVSVRLDPALVARMHAETAGARRRHAALRFLQSIYRHPTIGGPFRAIYSWLLPRQ